MVARWSGQGRWGSRAGKRVAVIGRFADRTLVDLYGGALPYSVSILDAIRDKVGSAARVQFAPNNDGNRAVEAAGGFSAFNFFYQIRHAPQHPGRLIDIIGDTFNPGRAAKHQVGQ